MDRERFIQSSTTTRIYEKKLLKRSDFERMIEAKDLDEAIRFLNDTPYQTYVNKLSRNEDYEIALKESLKDNLNDFYKLLPSTEVVDIFNLKYEYHNLKVILKENISGQDYSGMYINIGEFNFDKLKKEFESGDRKKLDSLYAEVISSVYDEFLEFKDPQNIEILIDKGYFERLKSLSDETEIELFKQYTEDLIDFTNIRTLLRCQKQGSDLNFLNRVLVDGGTIEKTRYKDFLNQKIDENSTLFKSARIYYQVKESIKEYNSSNNLSYFEKSMDDYLMEVMKEAKKITYGPEVPFAFLYGKETEIKNLRIIFVSKLNKLPTNFIRERLRESYA